MLLIIVLDLILDEIDSLGIVIIILGYDMVHSCGDCWGSVGGVIGVIDGVVHMVGVLLQVWW